MYAPAIKVRDIHAEVTHEPQLALDAGAYTLSLVSST